MLKKIITIMLLCLIVCTNTTLAVELYVWSTESKKIENNTTNETVDVSTSASEEANKENALN